PRHGTVGGPVVDDDEFPRLPRLRHDRTDRRVDGALHGSDRHDDADGGFHGAVIPPLCGLTASRCYCSLAESTRTTPDDGRSSSRPHTPAPPRVPGPASWSRSPRSRRSASVWRTPALHRLQAEPAP